jgi:hypothetical protein
MTAPIQEKKTIVSFLPIKGFSITYWASWEPTIYPKGKILKLIYLEVVFWIEEVKSV